MKPVIILGGGLWGGLLAYRLKRERPDVSFVLHEAEKQLGGNHTWSFHETDVTWATFQMLKPFIRASWNSYEVKFPQYTKQIDIPYHSIVSSKFHEILFKELSPGQLRLESRLTLDEAREMGALVIDARNSIANHACGWQKFLGLEIEFKTKHGLSRPILMDATVEQKDGYRFIYYLPLDENTLLIEDTRYSISNIFNEDEFLQDLMKIISEKGWTINRIIRKEIGALPLPLAKVTTNQCPGVLNLAGLFHDTTGYSLPDAFRVTDQLITKEFSYDALRLVLDSYQLKRKNDRRYFRLLNQLLFNAAKSNERYKIMQHFYRLPGPLIERFYRGEMLPMDRVRLFIGKPPVPVMDAIKTIIQSGQKELQS